MNKKGVTQNFLILLGVFIFGLVFLFSFNSMKTLDERLSNYNFEAFTSKINEDILTISNEFGAQTSKDYQVSNDFKQVCFLDRRNMDDSLESKFLESKVIVSKQLENSEYNAVFIGNDYSYGFAQVDGLNIDAFPYYTCKNIESGKFSVTFASKGSYVVIPDATKTQIQLSSSSNKKEVLYSADGVAKLTLAKGYGSVQAPADWDGKIFINIEKGPDAAYSDEYFITPSTLNFTSYEALFEIDVTGLGLTCSEMGSNAIYIMGTVTFTNVNCDEDTNIASFYIENLS
ncbi:hypothetical protein C0585_05455 [Candidatus Woesearchaeota archaeon]|nr:MAG: hypothetical protein C0585_05455 [Candidatus Woesearchaeota archaeon]